jgi:hypothetical protein
MKAFASDVVSNVSTPTTVPPSGEIRLYQRSSSGASAAHGGHQDAQTFKMTTRPRNIPSV